MKYRARKNKQRHHDKQRADPSLSCNGDLIKALHKHNEGGYVVRSCFQNLGAFAA